MRQAAVDIDTAALIDLLPGLEWVGLRVIGSLASPAGAGVVRLVVASEALPKECGGTFRLVQPVIEDARQPGMRRMSIVRWTVGEEVPPPPWGFTS